MSNLILLAKRSLQTGHGGVPLFCHYMQRIFPQAKLITLADVGIKDGETIKVSKELGVRAEAGGLIKKDDIVVVDGFWGRGMRDQTRVVIVNHGTYAGCIGSTHDLSRLQKDVFPGHHIVSVSPRAEEEARFFYNALSDEIILTGVDTKLFSPVSRGGDLTVGQIKSCKSEPFEQAKRAILARGGRWLNIRGKWPTDIVSGLRQCTVFVHISDYEGCSYAINEALSCGVPVVGTRVGLFWKYEMDFVHLYGMNVGQMVSAPLDVGEIVSAIQNIYHNYNDFQPREWTLKHNSLDNFAYKWKSYLHRTFGFGW